MEFGQELLEIDQFRDPRSENMQKNLNLKVKFREASDHLLHQF